MLTASGLDAVDSSFGERVTMALDIPESGLERFRVEIGERCAGRCEVEEESSD